MCRLQMITDQFKIVLFDEELSPLLKNANPVLTVTQTCHFHSSLSQTSPGFYMSTVQVFWKYCWKRRNCSSRAISPFPTLFSTSL